ncbi:MAG TPA: DUF4956 domain-containing protein [Chthoniobacteraceae bacterium]|nr:DUF4956 domain-containing protein [Chthoniobacteraceae bacterium]
MKWYRELEEVLLGREIHRISDLGLLPLALVLVLSLASAFIASWLYTRFYGGRATGTQIHRAFPLLGLSITAIFICIQFSLALSLGLLGALSIIRFRTPIKEPEEVAFVMLVIATSICCATFNFLFLAVILAAAFVALLALHYGPGFCQPRSGHGSLVLRMPEGEYRAQASALHGIIRQQLPKGEMDSLALDGESALVTYIFPKLSAQTFETLEQEVRRAVPGCGFNVFYTRAENLV